MVRLATAFQISPQKEKIRNQTPNPNATSVIPKTISTARNVQHPQQITPVNLMAPNYKKKLTSTTTTQESTDPAKQEFVIRMKNEDIRFAVECIFCFILMWILLIMSNKISKLQSHVQKLTNAIIDMKRR